MCALMLITKRKLVLFENIRSIPYSKILTEKNEHKIEFILLTESFIDQI